MPSAASEPSLFALGFWSALLFVFRVRLRGLLLPFRVESLVLYLCAFSHMYQQAEAERDSQVQTQAFWLLPEPLPSNGNVKH